MPVKIVTSPTNSQLGIINVQDLQVMKNDFINQVNLTPILPRVSVIKKYAWYITREEIEALLNTELQGKGLPTLLEIDFAIHLDQDDVCGNHLVDSLTVVLQGTDDNKSPLGIDDFVIIPGYNYFDSPSGLKNIEQKGCCPSSNP